MSPSSDSTIAAVDEIVDQYRDQCLWFLRRDYHPATNAERLRILEYIERYGDLDAYRRAARLKRWLLQSSSAPSAA